MEAKLTTAPAAYDVKANEASPVGLRFDDDKPRMDLLSPVALEGLAIVLAGGAKKYSERNWEKGMSWGKVIGSLLRHVFKFMAGEDLDPESGMPHVDHIMTNAMFLSHYYRHRRLGDDRSKTVSVNPKTEEEGR